MKELSVTLLEADLTFGVGINIFQDDELVQPSETMLFLPSITEGEWRNRKNRYANSWPISIPNKCLNYCVCCGKRINPGETLIALQRLLKRNKIVRNGKFCSIECAETYALNPVEPAVPLNSRIASIAKQTPRFCNKPGCTIKLNWMNKKRTCGLHTPSFRKAK